VQTTPAAFEELNLGFCPVWHSSKEVSLPKHLTLLKENLSAKEEELKTAELEAAEYPSCLQITFLCYCL
jgi:hypothetical protein